MFKILFVCIGATCRSPMASNLFNRKLKELDIAGCKSSFCGLSVDFESKVAVEAKNALKIFGVKRVVGAPIQISGEHLSTNNMIVCATEDYKQALANWADKRFLQKIYCFKDFCGYDIADPFGKGQTAYDVCAKQIETGIDRILEVLLNNGIIKHKKTKSI